MRRHYFLRAPSDAPSSPDDASYLLNRAEGVHGFYGASSLERLPTETALRAQTAAFKAITF